MPAQIEPEGLLVIVTAGITLLPMTIAIAFEFAVFAVKHEPPGMVMMQVIISPFASVELE